VGRSTRSLQGVRASKRFQALEESQLGTPWEKRQDYSTVVFVGDRLSCVGWKRLGRPARVAAGPIAANLPQTKTLGSTNLIFHLFPMLKSVICLVAICFVGCSGLERFNEELSLKKCHQLLGCSASQDEECAHSNRGNVETCMNDMYFQSQEHMDCRSTVIAFNCLDIGTNYLFAGPPKAVVRDVTDYDQCHDACAKHNECHTWSYHVPTKTCLLKGDISQGVQKQASNEMISGHLCNQDACDRRCHRKEKPFKNITLCKQYCMKQNHELHIPEVLGGGEDVDSLSGCKELFMYFSVGDTIRKIPSVQTAYDCNVLCRKDPFCEAYNFHIQNKDCTLLKHLFLSNKTAGRLSSLSYASGLRYCGGHTCGQHIDALSVGYNLQYATRAQVAAMRFGICGACSRNPTMTFPSKIKYEDF